MTTSDTRPRFLLAKIGQVYGQKPWLGVVSMVKYFEVGIAQS